MPKNSGLPPRGAVGNSMSAALASIPKHSPQPSNVPIAYTNKGTNAITPGPGSYDGGVGAFEKIGKAMQSAKALQSYGLDQFGIQLVKPHNVFSSSTKRFDVKKQKQMMQTANTVGPGTYHQETSWVPRRGVGMQPHSS